MVGDLDEGRGEGKMLFTSCQVGLLATHIYEIMCVWKSLTWKIFTVQ